MPIWEAVLLGIIQGLTEFLPISSTAHLLIARTLLGHEKPEDAFTVVIQLGTLAAVFIYFRTDIVRMLKGLVADVRAMRFASTPDSRLGWLIVLGTVPAVVVGFTFKKWLKLHFFNPTSIAVVTIVFALLMAASEWWVIRRARRGQTPREETDLGWLDALWVGVFQAMALMPGGSRSGTTITAGLFAGFSRSVAARFSFLLSLPVMLGAGLKEMYDERATLFAADQVGALGVGLLVSGVVGYLSIAFLLSYLKRYSLFMFVVYRLLAAGVIFALLAAGVLK